MEIVAANGLGKIRRKKLLAMDGEDSVVSRQDKIHIFVASKIEGHRLFGEI